MNSKYQMSNYEAIHKLWMAFFALYARIVLPTLVGTARETSMLNCKILQIRIGGQNMDNYSPQQEITREISGQQYSLIKIMSLWFAVTAPMGIARFYVFPLISNKVSIHPGILFWLLMIMGMMWQFVLSILILKKELGSLTFEKLKKRLWLNHPIDPKTNKVNKRLYWFVIPVILYTFFIESSGIFDFLSDGFIKMFPSFEPPASILIQSLASPEFIGAWYVVGIMLISALFNYLLGEELFFRGILLPKLNGVFGKWDWAVNGLLFGVYHVHKIELLPLLTIGSIFMSYLNRRYRSLYPGLIIHGIEFIPIAVVVLLVVLGVNV